MKFITSALAFGALLLAPASSLAASAGFTDSDVVFYGEVRQVGGAQTVLLQSGALELTFVNQSDPANRVTLQTQLEPTGSGDVKPYSYSLTVPMAYLPEDPRKNEFLAVGSQDTRFHIEAITVNGTPATLPDGSQEFYSLSFANRADQYRLDLIVEGDPTDTDGDGMPDWYEDLYGLNPNVADDTGDLDGDGWTNLSEFLRGSDPSVSNRDPQLATSELMIPESGEAGGLLQFHDSDTSPADLHITINLAAGQGIEARLDGIAAPAGTTLTAADIDAGRLTFVHLDPAAREVPVPLSWNDGGEPVVGGLIIRATTPSTETGNDAALWLDANSLPSPGESVSTWPDRSGNSRDAIQAMEGSQPRSTEDGDRRSLSFEDPGTHLFFQDPALPNGDHTLLVAYRSDGAALESQTVLSCNRGFIRLEPGAKAISYPGAPHYQMDGAAVRGHDATTRTSATSIFRRSADTLQNIFGHSYNGENTNVESLEPVLPTLGARRLALPVPEPVQEPFKGQLREILVYPTALPEQKLREAHDYLESKWADAVVWDQSTNLRPMTIEASGSRRHIIRGGLAADELRGGSLDNTISGGPGDDTLHAGPGIDRFVYGAIDTGKDTIIDFDTEVDVIDLSALFWGEEGDARQFLTTRLDTNFSEAIPTLDTVLIVDRPEGGIQEIVLRNRILGSTELIQLIVEGHIRMGALSIPMDVALSLAPGSEDTAVLAEDLEQSYTLELTRTGDGSSAALDVPIGLFQDALGEDLIIEGSSSEEGQRAVIHLDRGETTKQVTIRPVPDLDAEGLERWETAVLPHYRYAITGSSVARSVTDSTIVTLEVIQPHALVDGAQPARVRFHRAGSLSEPLTIDFTLEGSVVEGEHITALGRSIQIPAGQTSTDLTVTTQGGWDGSSTRMGIIRLLARDPYQSGNPHEATIYAAGTAEQLEGSGFENWVEAASGGEFDSIAALLSSQGPEAFSNYLRAYAFGLDTGGLDQPSPVSFRIVDGRPELSTRLQANRPDLQWQVQDSADLSNWSDVNADFSEEVTSEGLRFLGPPIDSDDSKKLYRLSFGLQTGSSLDGGLDGLAGGSDYGLQGPGSWNVNRETGLLTAQGSPTGQTSRLMVAVTDPTQLAFAMSLVAGDGSGNLRFYIDGALVTETTGSEVTVERTIDPIGTSLLMWEFTGDAGEAVIQNLPPRTE